MRIFHAQNGQIVIDQEEQVLSRVEGETLADADVSDLVINAENVAQLYNQASASDPRNGLEPFERYVTMKAKYLEKFSK